MSIGILAYGSLIEEPGMEIEPLIRDKRKGIETPFSIEFARSSTTRDGAPTLVPVDSEGSSVLATILVLNDDVNQEKAEDMLWRRETRNECSSRYYSPQSSPNPNKVVVEQINYFAGLDIVLYTRIGANITDLCPEKLADLAIQSAKSKAGSTGKDGISYLISIKRQNISTPLMPEYESEILRKTGATNLENALSSCRHKNA